MWTMAQTGVYEAESAWQAIWTFIQSAAVLLGQGLVRLINLILPASRAIGEDLAVPLGYLALLTIILLIFNLIAAARKVIWIFVGIGWILMIVRIVLEVLEIQ
ncbi:MAG: hypothetical protein NZ651_03980 [Candidatus Bipolaricaulota bacterium]|nr:hypothetical protein [Candidatus Bipolaricaulota bacterium]MDW8126912.1 hypothetical protein [Candidatus Bipolaricaulota bacterium]